ncbi:hypothetical protein BU16DRAFT_613803 [Lophium mytilinum]|uniref:Brl1/Brr6 domain-containing protein n=1 Tax=Lophium mytilinum TaxID=390894 RepID=A0A6A6R5Z8_9PEZI|nr:hypothetical protein BU16DRAFT_613803 [Lophium mytilinum]
MDRRTSTVPMDFEWANKTGDTDPTSPFMQLPRNNMANMNNTARKRNHNSVLESPTRIDQPNANYPRLRDPANQPFYFNNPPSPQKPLPPNPGLAHVHNSSAWDTRTPTKEVEFSSGGETPNTPDVGADSEATPETGARPGRLNRMLSSPSKGGRGSPSKSRRESLFGNFFNFNSSPRPSSQSVKADHYSRNGEKRITKKRHQKGVNREAVQQNMESDSEDDGGRSRRRRERERGSKKDRQDRDRDQDDEDNNTDKKRPEVPATPAIPRGSTIASVFSFIENHPGLPHILSFYAQFLLNLFLVFSAMYIMWSGWSAVTHEVDIQAQRAQTEVMIEIAKCARDWEENGCGHKYPPPSLKQLCGNWAACKERDARKVARASVSAKTFAMIFNSFVEEIGYKAMLFTSLVLITIFVISNYAFSTYRSTHAPRPPPQYDPYMHPPATPQRYPSQGFIDQQGFFTPYTSFHASQPNLALEPAPSGGVDAATGAGAEQKKAPVGRTINWGIVR